MEGGWTPASVLVGVGVDSTVWSRWPRVMTIRHLAGRASNAGIAEGSDSSRAARLRDRGSLGMELESYPETQPRLEKVGMNR